MYSVQCCSAWPKPVHQTSKPNLHLNCKVLGGLRTHINTKNWISIENLGMESCPHGIAHYNKANNKHNKDD